MRTVVLETQRKALYEFGPFSLDAAQRVLLRDGQPVPLTPKAIDVLHAYAVSGKTVEARKIITELVELSKKKHVPPFEIALVHIGLGEADRAFELLESAYLERHGLLVYLKVEPIFDGLRSDSRFPSLLRRIGLS